MILHTALVLVLNQPRTDRHPCGNVKPGPGAEADRHCLDVVRLLTGKEPLYIDAAR
jgi:hypothetical protein